MKAPRLHGEGPLWTPPCYRMPNRGPFCPGRFHGAEWGRCEPDRSGIREQDASAARAEASPAIARTRAPRRKAAARPAHRQSPSRTRPCVNGLDPRKCNSRCNCLRHSSCSRAAGETRQCGIGRTTARTPSSSIRRRPALQPGTVSLATSKLYTRAVLPPAILACSSSGTPSRISARIFRDWGNVDSLCG